MSINEVMKFVERVSHYDPARPQDLSRPRAAIVLHVAEEVARERDECALIADKWATDEQRKFGNGGPAAAIRARAEKETT